jgi:hypothetical protein
LLPVPVSQGVFSPTTIFLPQITQMYYFVIPAKLVRLLAEAGNEVQPS